MTEASKSVHDVLPLSEVRFDALAGYTRRPEALFLAREVEWYADRQERVVGVLLNDFADDEYGGFVLGRDGLGRFRAVGLPRRFVSSQTSARDDLLELMAQWSRASEEQFLQGDEKGAALELFPPVVPGNRLNAAFLQLAGGEGFSPARRIIEAMLPYFDDVDGNFVEQFQTTAFDSRIWELYLFAMLHEQGFAFDRSFNAPDFLCRRFRDDVFIEAVTVNPTKLSTGMVAEPSVPHTKSEFVQYYREYMPMKWGSALTSKLKKEYWKLPHVKGKPLVLAVQDFHVPRAMTFLSHSILEYLYGLSFSALYDEAGKLHVTSTERTQHQWGTKIIESNFFGLPGGEHVSAVITNPTATISKFNRMAHVAGFGSPHVKMMCEGFCHDHDPNAAMPKRFFFDVCHPQYSETWVEGTNVYHNPNALVPLDTDFLPDAAHHRYHDGIFSSLMPEFHPYSSQTMIVTPDRLQG